jgi:hypothetical protein
MLATKMSGTIFIRENTLLPAGLAIESEAFLPGWRAIKNLDGFALARKIEGTNWNFFYLAGEIKAAVLGRDRLGTLHRAVKRVLAKQEKQFNSLEMRVVSKRFLGIPYISVAANSRHIQQGSCLVPTKDLDLRIPTAVAPETGPGSGREPHHEEVIANRHTAISSS